jgi:hypothetical protein
MSGGAASLDGTEELTEELASLCRAAAHDGSDMLRGTFLAAGIPVRPRGHRRDRRSSRRSKARC